MVLPLEKKEERACKEMGLKRIARKQLVKNLPAVQETWVRFMGQEDALEKEMATHSSILARKKSMDRGAWWATVCRVAESDTIEHAFHFPLA